MCVIPTCYGFSSPWWPAGPCETVAQSGNEEVACASGTVANVSRTGQVRDPGELQPVHRPAPCCCVVVTAALWHARVPHLYGSTVIRSMPDLGPEQPSRSDSNSEGY